ncbi:MAG: ion transporter [Phycisphaerales bacterium JB037]
MSEKDPPVLAPWREKLHEVIFEADTRIGRAFDVALLWAIVLSVLAVSLESVTSIRARYGSVLVTLEWFFTILFTLEYLVRLISVRRPLRYARSFFGVIDLLAIIPTYLSLLLPGAQSLIVIRALRLLRIFRVLKLARYLDESRILLIALRASRPKITVFLFAVLTMVFIIGAMMYLIEGADAGFTSIPRSVYWAIVTLTTVGFGDITPQTPLGQAFASLVMIMGYGIIAVPTGIVSVEIAEVTRARARKSVSTQACPACGHAGHEPDARFCKLCGENLHPNRASAATESD